MLFILSVKRISKLKKLLILLIFLSAAFVNGQIVKFAAVGDYGKSGLNELNVSNLIKSWNPEFIITLGDNNYELGEQSTIDANIGQYYSQFIYPYSGSYGQGDTVSNRFFPSLGNHDWYTLGAIPYLNYFTLPGNERYYDFVKGNVHFFSLDSDPNEPDGVDSNSVQALWLKSKLASSSQTYNIVYFHHPPYSSSEHGSNVYMQWPFKEWGASAVIGGHDHSYERIVVNGIMYFVNGLGGKSIYSFNAPVSGSQVRYNNNFGAMLINSYYDSLVFKFFSVSTNQKDNYQLPRPQKILHLTLLVEGLYNPSTNLMVRDTVMIYLRNSSPPYSLVDSARGLLNDSGKNNFIFPNADNATDYYIIAEHRNSIETWSKTFNKFVLDRLNYDFTLSQSQAYGNNMTLKGSKYCVYSGDVNRDDVVDAVDNLAIENAAFYFLTGYIGSDLNGDNITDASDMSISDNNSVNYIISVRP